MKAGCRVMLIGVLSALFFALPVATAVAAEEPYEYNPLFSLRGDCGTSAVDPVPDPGCPGGTHPPKPFDTPDAVAVDAYGNEYVSNAAGGGAQGRIDIFDHEGNFISELPDPHGPTAVAVDTDGVLYVYENVTSAVAEIVRYRPEVYEPEVGAIEYKATAREVVDTVGSFIGGLAVDTSTNHLFAAFSIGEIKEYGSSDEDNSLLNTITHEKLSKAVFLAVDAKRRRLYSSDCKKDIFECQVLVFKADAPYDLLAEIDGSTTPAKKFLAEKGWNSIAVDEETGHFFIEDLQKSNRIFEFGESFEYLSTISRSFLEGAYLHQMAISNSVLNGDAANRRFLFVPVSSTSGTQEAFAFNPPNVRPPLVEGAEARGISETEALLQATVDPRGAQTHYVFEIEEAGSGEPRVVSEGDLPATGLPGPVVAGVEGLEPGVDYRFTVSATNEKGSAETEAEFTTYADAPTASACPNQVFRTGFSSNLPDCRAYELVTPPDTNGRPPKGIVYGDFPTLQASPQGDAVTFITEGGPLPGMEGAGGFKGDRYRAHRGPSGWNSVSTGPSGVETNAPEPGSVSPDQGFGFWVAAGAGSAVIDEKETYYVMYPDGHSELNGRGSIGTDPAAWGRFITENGSHIVFETKGGTAERLEPTSPPVGIGAVYDRTADEVTHVVSLLPGEVTPNNSASYVGASSDGAGIAFEIDSTLYLRLRNEVSFEIGTGVTFAGISKGGGRIFYVEGGDLLAFDTDSEGVLEFTDTGDVTVVNVAPDGSRAYFVSPTAIPGSGENPKGALPVPGQQNLYWSDADEVHFVATVTLRDVQGEIDPSSGLKVDGLGLWTKALADRQMAKDPSRLTPDGTVLLFQSRANLDGYDPEGSPQIYRYDSDEERLDCISCIPTKVPAAGGASLQSFGGLPPFVEALSSIAVVRNLRDDGRRAVFESEEPLVSTDTNEVQDVYEWEDAGVGSCTRPEGCIYLISSGQSGADNYLYGASGSGDDVFFTTEDVLVAGDNDTSSIYDARVGGGFPSASAAACEGEGCRPTLTPPPGLAVPASPAPGARDNVRPRKRCPKGKRRVKRQGKVRCVKKHRKHQRRKGGATRRAGR